MDRSVLAGIARFRVLDKGREAAVPRHEIGQYRLGTKIGSGGMGTVHVAWDQAGRKVALKRMLPGLAVKQTFIEMFRNEAYVLTRLKHPNIASFIEFNEAEDEPFVVTEYVSGASCRAILRAAAVRRERCPPAAALYILFELLGALDHVHTAKDENGRPLCLVHRDVSPGNILVNRRGEIKLIDFGIVQSDRFGRESNPGELKGKPGYMSPEQVAGSRVDGRSDLFSVGTVLGELLTGRPLFSSPGEFDLLMRMYEGDLSVFGRYGTDLPESVRALVHRALVRHPGERFQSATDFRREVRSAAESAGLPLDESELLMWMGSLQLVPSRSGVYAAARTAVTEPDSGARRSIASSRISVVPVALDTNGLWPGAHLELRLGTRPSADGCPQSPREDGGAASLVEGASLADALGMIATGRLTADDEIAAMKAPFTRVSEHPILGPFALRPAYRFQVRRRERAVWRRRFSRASLPALLFQLFDGKTTGLLVARDGARQKSVYFRGGDPVFAASTDASELLGARLVAEAWIDAAQLDEALEHACRWRCELGQALIRMGLLRPGVLIRALVRQLEARVAELGKWTAGELAFYPFEPSGMIVPSARPMNAYERTRCIIEQYEDKEILTLLEARFTSGIVRLMSPLPSELSQMEAAILRDVDGCAVHDLPKRIMSAKVPSQSYRCLFLAIAAGLLTITA